MLVWRTRGCAHGGHVVTHGYAHGVTCVTTHVRECAEAAKWHKSSFWTYIAPHGCLKSCPLGHFQTNQRWQQSSFYFVTVLFLISVGKKKKKQWRSEREKRERKERVGKKKKRKSEK